MHIEAHSDEDVLEHMSERFLVAGIGLEKSLALLRRRLIIDALAMSQGNQTRAAERLHVHRNTLLRHLKELKIDRSHYIHRKALRRLTHDGLVMRQEESRALTN